MSLVSLFKVMKDIGHMIPCFKHFMVSLNQPEIKEIRFYLLFLQDSKFKKFENVIVIVMK